MQLAMNSSVAAVSNQRFTASSTLWANSADDILKYFSYFFFFFFFFFERTGIDISCKLSSLETICMKFQILRLGKNKKNHSKLSSAEDFTQNAKR